MNRRDFVALGGAATAWPLAARAAARDTDESSDAEEHCAHLLKALAESGSTAGRNVAV